MFLAAIWRYPVKSMHGERLERAFIDLDGVEGDRIVQVRNASGRVVTARTRPDLLRYHATLGPNGEPLVDGRPWNSPEVRRDATIAIGEEATLTRSQDRRFDVRPLLVATDGAIAAIGEDVRRFRPNLLIGGVDGLEERAWENKLLVVGDVKIHLVDLRARCIMTTYDPDTLEQDTSVLRRIFDRYDGKLALNAAVITPGIVSVGDPVTIEAL